MKNRAVTLCFCFLLFSADVWSQGFSSLDNDLGLLENLITDTLNNMEEQQKLLEDLKQSLNESGSIITEQENLLRDLQIRLNEMSETYKMQSSLSAKYAQSSRFWRNFTLTAIPVTALISGGLIWAVMR